MVYINLPGFQVQSPLPSLRCPPPSGTLPLLLSIPDFTEEPLNHIAQDSPLAFPSVLAPE